MASSDSASIDEKLKDEELVTESRTDSIEEEEELSEEAKFSAPPLVPPPSPAAPDGGLRAWLQVLGSVIVFVNLWGFTFAFGSFQAYFERTLLASEPPSTISWIGTFQVFFLIFGGILTGPLFDLGYYKTMLYTGAVVETIGVFMTSLCSEWYQFFLAQGVLMGLGCAFLYVPGMALVGRTFKKNRAIALAITSCGAPLGGIIYTLIFEQLIGKIGFGWTVRVMGFVMLSGYIVAVPLLLFRASNLGDLSSGTKRKLLDLTAFRDLPFCWYTLSNFLVFLGYMNPFNYMATYGQAAVGLTRSFSLYVIMIAQASSIVGRLIAGQLARRIGVMIPWITCAGVAGAMALAWTGAHTKGSFIAVTSLYGCFSGGLIPLPPSVFPVVCPDAKVFGARLGMAQGIGAFASLIGSPIGGALIRGTKETGMNFLGLQLFSGVTLVLGGCNLVGLWILLARRREMGKLRI